MTKLEFGNPEHIAKAKEGARIAALLAKSPKDARRTKQHDCNCHECDFPTNSCADCGFHRFERFRDEKAESGTRDFCSDCGLEAIF